VLAREVSSLEPLPTSVTQLAALVCAGTPDLADVVEIVQYDQALTATLLRTANSSWSASKHQITSVHDAVVRLGSAPVLSIAFGVHARDRMAHAVPEYGLGEGDLWAHSVAALVAGELICRLAPRRPPAETATAALLHDIGKLVMARFLRSDLLVALRDAQGLGLSRVEAELEVLGIHHAELGGLIAQSWGLPAGLVCGIRRHHDPDDDHEGVGYGVHLADVVAKMIGSGLDDNPDLETYTRAAGELGLTAVLLDQIRDGAETQYREVLGRFV
jgi:HD-like signal output (HDOD) protein